MKIKIKRNIKVELSTLVRLRWNGLLPVLIIHEKFEKPLKWILRILTIIGVATSLISIDKWYWSLSLSLVLLGIEQFFERAVFEYTTLVMIPLPDFDIDYSQWKTNGFLIANVVNERIYSYMGPSFESKEYAVRFFTYLMSWNWDSNIDDDNSIIVSIVIEPNEKYTTYIYSNPQNKNLDRIFSQQAKKNELSKYGKQQQKLFTQMIFYNTLDFKAGYFIEQFLNKQSPNQKFYFVPSVIPNQKGNEPEFLYEYAILKYEYRLKNRNQVKKNDVEYYFKPN